MWWCRLWRFVVDLAADAAEPDDTIEIVSAMNKSSSVSFHLTNQVPLPFPFPSCLPQPDCISCQTHTRQVT